jgi:uncharacterized OB-fold protein
MTATTPALGAEGWFTTDGGPALLGSRCIACGTVAFPKATTFCPNPACAGTEFAEHRLASTGTVWSYTDARYQPPPPYVPTSDPYEPFAIAAVELDPDGAAAGIVVLGQMTAGTAVTDLHVGTRVELVVEPLFDDQMIWKWKVVGDG